MATSRLLTTIMNMRVFSALTPMLLAVSSPAVMMFRSQHLVISRGMQMTKTANSIWELVQENVARSPFPVGHEAELLVGGEILEKLAYSSEEVVDSDPCQDQVLRGRSLMAARPMMKREQKRAQRKALPMMK